jgi:hypothetical protein
VTDTRRAVLLGEVFAASPVVEWIDVLPLSATL